MPRSLALGRARERRGLAAAESRPPAGGRSRDGRVVRLRDARVDVPRFLPAPLLQAEAELCQKVPAGVSFPLHPLSAVTLYDRAQDVLAASGVLAQLDGDERSTLDLDCWRIVGVRFSPGVGVRAAMDRVLEDRSLRPNLTGAATDDEKTRRMQLAHLAGWAVFRAASDWSQEAK